MLESRVNYAMYHKKDFYYVSDSQVRESSAGVFGWSEAKVETGTDACPFVPGSTGSSMDLPPGTDDDWHGESSNLTKSKDPPESKPRMSLRDWNEAAAIVVKAYQGELDEKERQLRWQQQMMDGGRQPSWICNARDARQVIRVKWKEVRRGR